MDFGAALDLPSLRLGESLDLVSRFAKLNRSTPLDYLPDDSVIRLQQCKANNGVRELLRDIPRAKRDDVSAEAPDFIELRSTDNCNAPVLVDLEPSSSSEEGSKCVLEELRQFAADKAAAVTEAPWLTFFGHSPRPDAALVDWKEAMADAGRSLDFFGRLHEEICALCLWLDPSPEELLLRQRVIARIQTVCELLWPYCEVVAFGSYYTGLSLPNGDIDVSVCTCNGGSGSGSVAAGIRELRLLTVYLNGLGVPHALELIAGARVPIVKMVDAETGVSVDVAFNTTSALSTSTIVIESIRQYPWLRPLVLVLKLFLQQRGLNETFRGGVGSYLLFCLVLSFLQQHKLTNSESFRERANLGHLLFDFLQLYGRDFNYETTGISVNDGGHYFLKTRKKWFNRDRPWLLSVESPLAIDQDIGKGSYEIRTVRNAFRQAFLSLAELHSSRSTEGSILCAAGVVFLGDPLLTNRIRLPVQYTGASAVERSEWWKSVQGLMALPVGAPRPPPKLPTAILTQVRRELEQVRQGLPHRATEELRRAKRSMYYATDQSNGSAKRRRS